MIKGPEHQSREERPRLFSLDQRRLRGHLVCVHKYLMGRGEEEGASPSPVVLADRRRGNGHKLEHMKFHWNTRKHFFFYREVVGSLWRYSDPTWKRSWTACSG